MSPALLQAMDMAVSAAYFLLFARVISNWFPNARNSRLVVIIYMITEPVLGPIRNLIRRLIPDGSIFAMMDFSPVVALILLQILYRIILSMIII